MTMAPLELDITITEETLKEGARKVINQVKPSWDKLCFQLFTDGITNKLIGGYQEGNNDEMVLVRVYGAKTEMFIDRKLEQEYITFLHKNGLGPELYANFSNGLAYEYLPGVTLDEKSCRNPRIFPLICDNIAKLHSVVAPGSKSIVLWDNIDKFLKLMPTGFPEPERQARFQNEVGTKEEIESIAVELRGVLNNTSYPIVFSHSDLLLGNVIYNDAKRTVSFIDFEYAGYNYQPYDVANHFDEYAGITDTDYNRFPDKEYQLVWIKEYLRKYRFYTQPGTEENITDKEVQNFQIMVDKFSLAAHFFWGIHALVQAKESTLDFDFLDYAIVRLNEYTKNKGKLLVPLIE